MLAWQQKPPSINIVQQKNKKKCTQKNWRQQQKQIKHNSTQSPINAKTTTTTSTINNYTHTPSEKQRFNKIKTKKKLNGLSG